MPRYAASRLNHFKIPDGFVQIAFSGGRTSAMMLHHILEANGSFPDRVQIMFQNTGREMPQTLDFVQECAERWGVHVVWLEYALDPETNAPKSEVVSHNSASRNGEPFEALIRKKKYLPNQQSRFCTVELKIRTAKRYLRSLGWDYWTNCVGLRADEPSRLKPEGVKLPGDRWSVWQPMANAGLGKHDVSAFWEAQPFDLMLPNVNGHCWLGNCDGCFLKSEANIAALARDFPERHQWWEAMESRAASLTSGSAKTWSHRYTRREIREFMDRQQDAFDVNDGQLCQANDGECH